MQHLSTNKQRGFTLIEIAIIAPLMILVAISIVAVLIGLVSATVGPNARSIQMQQEEKAFDIIEGDINNSTGFLSTLPANFTDANSSNYANPPSGTTVLRIATFDQITNPNDSSGTKVVPAFKGGSPCNNTTDLGASNITPIVAIYFVRDNTLFRRTLTDNTNPATCGTKLAKQTCQSGCASDDLQLVIGDSVSEFGVTYYTGITGNTTTTDPTAAQSAQIRITSSINAGGDSFSYTATLRAARMNN